MNIMHKLMVVVAMAAAIVCTGFGDTVTNVRGVQRPNSNLVDIYYDLNAVDGGTYKVDVSIEGRTSEVSATTFSGDVGEGIAPGKNRHIVWEAGIDWRGNKGDVKAIVTATVEARKTKPKKVQLWEGGPYWADRNIGANAPWEYGLYFWWGDTTGHSPGYNFYYDNLAIYTYKKSVSELQSAGWVTREGVLASTYDAAHVKWGGNWRMPTIQELSNLCNNCDWSRTTINGVKGNIVRGRGDYASKSIFLPAAGDNRGASLLNPDDDGVYWSSSPSADNAGACYLFSASGVSPHAGNDTAGRRYLGRSIRPVQSSSK